MKTFAFSVVGFVAAGDYANDWGLVKDECAEYARRRVVKDFRDSRPGYKVTSCGILEIQIKDIAIAGGKESHVKGD